MKIDYTKQFLKQFKKLRVAERERFLDRLGIWKNNPADQRLHNHQLAGKYKGAFSINIGGDLRAVYRYVDDETVWFDLIGTHSQLYGK